MIPLRNPDTDVQDHVCQQHGVDMSIAYHDSIFLHDLHMVPKIMQLNF